MTNVFISYRRTDTTAGYASWIYERLAQRYGAQNVFMDMDSLSLGVDFVEQLQQALSKTDVALVLIGPGWLDARDASGQRRLDDEADFVRIEVGEALRASTRVIPVLIDGASIPRSTQLPEDLRPLIRRQALTFERQGGAAITNLLQAMEELANGESGDAAADTAKLAAARERADQTAAPARPHPQRSGGRPMALIVVALVALVGIAAGALAAGGVFSHATSTQTITSSNASHKTGPAQSAASKSTQTNTAAAGTTPGATSGPSGAAASTGRSSSVPVASLPKQCSLGLGATQFVSCGLASNVFYEYYKASTSGSDASFLNAWSPAKHEYYTARCSSGNGLISCAISGTTDPNAQVEFTQHALSLYSPQQANAYAAKGDLGPNG